MTTKEHEYYKQRVEETVNDLIETITSKQRIMIAKIIDWVVFFGIGILIVYFVTYQSVLINDVTAVIAYLILYLVIRLISKGVSLGNLIMNIRFVSVRTKKRISIKEYIMFWKKLLSLQMKYQEIFNYYFSYDNRLSQNVPMKRVGFILVDVSEYKRYRKIYEHNKTQLQSFES